MTKNNNNNNTKIYWRILCRRCIFIGVWSREIDQNNKNKGREQTNMEYLILIFIFIKTKRIYYSIWIFSFLCCFITAISPIQPYYINNGFNEFYTQTMKLEYTPLLYSWSKVFHWKCNWNFPFWFEFSFFCIVSFQHRIGKRFEKKHSSFKIPKNKIGFTNDGFKLNSNAWN